jgi:hypothetical protein
VHSLGGSGGQREFAGSDTERGKNQGTAGHRSASGRAGSERQQKGSAL